LRSRQLDSQKLPIFNSFEVDNSWPFARSRASQKIAGSTSSWLRPHLESLLAVSGPIPHTTESPTQSHTAAQQLRSVNPVHEFLSFLVLVNHDKAAKGEDLISVLTGQWDPLHGIFDETHTQYSNGRIREEKREIDLYLWFDSFTEHEPFKYRLVHFGNDKTRDQVCNMLEIDPKAIKNVG
jgi:hypothetical protein